MNQRRQRGETKYMRERGARLKEMLKSLEKFKVFIMREINDIRQNDTAIRKTTVYPMAKVQPMIIDDYSVFQFAYEGMLPLHKENDPEYNSMIRHYYYSATFDSYNFSEVEKPVFNHATLVFVHYFKDKIIRDLDNRNEEFIQDAIKLTGLIKDDNWKNLWNLNIGFYDGGSNHVQVYLVPTECLSHFIDYLKENHEDMKESVMKKSLYKHGYSKIQREKREKEKKIKEINQREENDFF